MGIVLDTFWEMGKLASYVLRGFKLPEEKPKRQGGTVARFGARSRMLQHTLENAAEDVALNMEEALLRPLIATDEEIEEAIATEESRSQILLDRLRPITPETVERATTTERGALGDSIAAIQAEAAERATTTGPRALNLSDDTINRLLVRHYEDPRGAVRAVVAELADQPQNMDLSEEEIRQRVLRTINPNGAERPTPPPGRTITEGQLSDYISTTAMPASELLLPTHYNRRTRQPIETRRVQVMAAIDRATGQTVQFRLPPGIVYERDQRDRTVRVFCEHCTQRLITIPLETMEENSPDTTFARIADVSEKHICGKGRIQHPIERPPPIRVIRFKKTKEKDDE